MQFKNFALVATVALSTFTEASPARFHLETRELHTREPKDGKKTGIVGAVGALVGLLGMPLTYLFHTAGIEDPELSVPTNSTNSTTFLSPKLNSTNSTRYLSPKLSPVRIYTRELQTREPANGKKTGIVGAIGALVGLIGMPLTFMFHTAGIESPELSIPTNSTNSTGYLNPKLNSTNSTRYLSPKLSPVSLSTRDIEARGKLAAGAAGLGLFTAFASSIMPFIFKRPGPRPKALSFEVNGTESTNSTLSPEVTPFEMSASKIDMGKIGAGAAGLGLITAVASSIFPFIFKRPGPRPQSIGVAGAGSEASNSTSPLVTDDVTFTLSAFRNNVSIAEALSFPYTPNIGFNASLALDCGNIAVTLRAFEAFTCDFHLPSDMPNGTLTGENPGQSLQFEVSGDCVGVEFKVTNECVDCPTPLNVDCQGNLEGTDNDVELCATDSTLAKC